MLAEGKLDLPPGTARELTDRELLAVARLAVSNPYEAIGDYVLSALGYDPQGSSLPEKGDVLANYASTKRGYQTAKRSLFLT